jgi:xanthine dehydrogenase YagR molybdenum-binding subunit
MAATSSAYSVIGNPRQRIDGPLKVSGGARYTSDFHFPGMLYAVPVGATIANGEIRTLNTAAAERMPGVRAIYHRKNFGKLFRVAPIESFGANMAHVSEARPPLEDDVIRYYGQYVAVAVADTWEQAKAAADAVEVIYRKEKPNVDPDLNPEKKSNTEQKSETPPKVESERGDAERSFQESAVQIDAVYKLPPETHNPIELHSTVAQWDGPNVTIYESTQGVVNHRNVLAQMLGVQQENVRVISKFIGSGFGGKLFPWTHSVLTAAVSRNLGKPVQLVVSRRTMFQCVGHRPQIWQRIRIGATPEGKLTSLRQDWVNHTSILDDYKENCGEATPFMYSVPNLRVTSSLARRNVGTPTSMRGPGAVPGLFATESAMDELAIRLKMDPVQLRLLNEPKIDEGENLPFSSRHIVECYTTGAERFGWANRNPKVGSMKRDGLTLGWGMVGGTWVADRYDAKISLELRDDGSARIASATQDIGTGTYTVMALLASKYLGLPIDRIDVVLGDTGLPPGPLSGGSRATASLVPAVSKGAGKLIESLLSVARKIPKSKFADQKSTDLAFTNGRVHKKNEAPSTGVPFAELLKQGNLRAVSGVGSSDGTSDGTEKPKFSSHSYCAHFVEVTWQPEIARLRVSRVVTVIDAGRILNPLAGRNQIQGAVVMGIGMCLFEATAYDPQNGAPYNASLADYLVATNPDVPKLEVHFLDYPDLHLNELGARGIGEIGLAGAAAAIANAVYHATGVRVRSLPIRIEDLLGA